MKRKPAAKPKFVVATFSADATLVATAKDRARALDTDFSKYVRALVRKDLKEAGLQVQAA